MGRKWLLAALGATTACAAIAVLSFSSLLGARPAAPAAAAQPAGEATLAKLDIGQVVLFSSGVGYFQREGSVEGNTRVDLAFPVSDINDLIKSMVLRDLDGGPSPRSPTTATRPSNAPSSRSPST